MPDFTIGERPATPPDQNYKEEPDATVAAKGDLPDSCHWSLKITVATATLTVPGRENCLYHFYKIVSTLTRTCVNSSPASTSKTETRITRTGPHCSETPATVPQPGKESVFKGSKKPEDGPEEVVIELPDGTKVTLTLPEKDMPTVTLGYPSGSPTTLPKP